MGALKRLQLDCKTGFNNTGSSPIVILDEFYREFYNTSEMVNRISQFNLPAGEYYIMSGKFQPMASPVNYPLFSMPRLERRMPQNPENFKINYANNPNTGTIHWDNHYIVLDKSLRSQPFTVLEFIVNHEYAHRFYDKNEHACDLYATNKMLRAGYNPEQIGYAIVDTLSDGNNARKERLVEMLVNRFTE